VRAPLDHREVFVMTLALLPVVDAPARRLVRHQLLETIALALSVDVQRELAGLHRQCGGLRAQPAGQQQPTIGDS
jgi:hypothetical protein